ncbi:MAG: AAA family ATPase [Myxococcales bacterium]
MSKPLRLVIENVRRIERAELAIEAGSRTILVGRNNSGKTTLLDMIARALWSLPANHENDNFRSFNTSWYRRADKTFARPKVTVTLPESFLQTAVCASPEAELVFELWGDVVASRVRTDALLDVKLMSTNCDVVSHAGTQRLVSMEGGPEPEISRSQALTVSNWLVDEANWQPLDPAREPQNRQGINARSLYEMNTPFSRALAERARRVLYIPAGRQPSFGAANALTPLSHTNMSNVTSLLLFLQATARTAFDGLSTCLGLLFPEVQRLKMAGVSGLLAPEIEFTDGRTDHVGNMGYGFQNAIHILTILTMCPRDAILIVDEPEKGLNQTCQRDLAALMETLRPDVTLLVATQSEAFCRGFSSSSAVVLVEASAGTSITTRLEIVASPDDLRSLARAMGVDPLYLGGGGRLIYVEGTSDQLIMEKWIQLMFPHATGFQVVALGGCGKISEEFVKPFLIAFRDRVFLFLDSDRPSGDQTYSPEVTRLVRWLSDNNIENRYVLRRREIENYVGVDSIAEVAGVHPNILRGTPGHEDWHDIKSVFAAKVRPYDERRISVGAFERLDSEQRRRLFGEETEEILAAFRTFLHSDG